MAHFEVIGKDHMKRSCYCQLEECTLDCPMWRKLANKPTNADRIRQMTDEELAEKMHKMTLISMEIGLSEEWWVQWLKSPAGEERK